MEDLVDQHFQPDTPHVDFRKHDSQDLADQNGHINRSIHILGHDPMHATMASHHHPPHYVALVPASPSRKLVSQKT